MTQQSDNINGADQRQAPADQGMIQPVQRKRRGATRPQALIVILVLAAVLVLYAVRYWHYASSHVATDDAYLASDNTIISPQVPGIVKEVPVADNQQVKKGQLLVVLEDSTYRVAVEQARANLNMAIAQAKGAGATVELTTKTGNAQIMQAQGLVEQASSSIEGAKADIARAEAAVGNSRAVAKGAEANIATAEAGVSVAVANKQRYADTVNSAQAAVDAAQAVYNKAVRDADRASKLWEKGAISEQASDQAQLTVLTVKAALAGKEADLNAARQQASAADASISQAKAQLDASREQANAARSGIRQSQAQQAAALQGVRLASAKRRQALGQLDQAGTAPSQVAVSQSAKAQALAKVDQAQAALDDANLRLSYTRIFAPGDGIIGKKSVEVGSQVQTGAPLMAIINKDDLWVTANFKETQLPGIEPGEGADVKIDAFRGTVFQGHVESISKATGATFALLPPDNATGNFTKVVQRIPVKIVLDPNQPGADKLRSGLSVVAIITTR